jgi:hypothetical protein
MTKGTTEQYRLFCDDRLVGLITNAQWSDFPWVIGAFVSAAIDDDVREVIEWFAAIGDAEELVDTPFPDHLLNNWWIERLSGERKQVDVPIIDLSEGTIEWV